MSLLRRPLDLVLTIGLTTSLSATAVAQTNPAKGYTGEFERPYGFGYGEESTPYDANTRDRRGNRIVIDGRIITGEDLSTLSQSGVAGYQFSGQGAAYGNPALGYGQTNTVVGNQLNVITQGSNNTVIVDSTQINNGDQTVVLNGELNLDD